MSNDLHLPTRTATPARVVGLCHRQIDLVVIPFGAAASCTLTGAPRRMKHHALATGHVEIMQDHKGGMIRLLNVLPPVDEKLIRPGQPGC